MKTLADLAEWLGSLWGDQGDYLVCDDGCGRRFVWSATGEDPGQSCPDCGGQIYAHVPHSEALLIRYVCWKGDQRWLPQRMYCFGGDDDAEYRFVQWCGREWRKRRAPDGLFS